MRCTVAGCCLQHQGHQQGCCQHETREGNTSSAVLASWGDVGGAGLELASSQGGDIAWLVTGGVHGAVGGVGLESLCGGWRAAGMSVQVTCHHGQQPNRNLRWYAASWPTMLVPTWAARRYHEQCSD